MEATAPVETIHENGQVKAQRVVELRPHVARKLLQIQGRLEETKEMLARAQERNQLAQTLFNATLTDALEDGGVVPSPDAQYSIDYRTNTLILDAP